MAVTPGVEDSRTTDSIDQAVGAAEAKAAVHLATHFPPATIQMATRLHLLTAGVSRVGRLHLTSGMRSRTATKLRTTREAAAATRARAALKEGTTMVISPEAANFTSGRPAAEAVTTWYYEGYSAAGLDGYQPRHYSEPYDASSQQQQQQQQRQQQQQPYDASSSPPAASPSPDPGTSAPAAPLHFAGIAHRVRRGKSKIDSELRD